MSKRRSSDPEIRRAQALLADSLKEACLAEPETADTGELIKIEAALSAADEAAKAAIARRLRRKDAVRAPTTSTHRVFDDAKGVRWNAFAILPTEIPTGRAHILDAYAAGWLSFHSSTETRRLAPIPEGWAELSDDALCELCARATVAQRIVFP